MVEYTANNAERAQELLEMHRIRSLAERLIGYTSWTPSWRGCIETRIPVGLGCTSYVTRTSNTLHTTERTVGEWGISPRAARLQALKDAGLATPADLTALEKMITTAREKSSAPPYPGIIRAMGLTPARSEVIWFSAPAVRITGRSGQVWVDHAVEHMELDTTIHASAWDQIRLCKTPPVRETEGSLRWRDSVSDEIRNAWLEIIRDVKLMTEEGFDIAL